MTKHEFNDRTQPLMRKHKEMFGYIPVIDDYNCTPSAFLLALTRSMMEAREIHCFLKEA